MKINNKLKLAAAIAAGIALVGCGSDDEVTSSTPRDAIPETVTPEATSATVDCAAIAGGPRTIDLDALSTTNSSTISDELAQALGTAQTCDTIVIPEGAHVISSSLNYNGNASGTMVTNLTIQGAGMPQTVAAAAGASGLTALDFTSTTGDGFFIQNTMNITMKDFGVFEAANNAIKLKNVDGIHLDTISTVWETDFSEDNGAYGLYPVETSNVLIEDCYVVGSADAGVYVGQSENIIVRGCHAEKNVAGIEIENSKYADVYNNTATGNTGGLLVFDLPIGNGIYGSGVRIFDNTITSNNAVNFAVQGGSAAGVHIVPPGTGMIILSTSDVEIYNNTITDNETMAIAITSFMLPDPAMASAPDQGIGSTVFAYNDIHPYTTILADEYSPLVRGISIHDNVISQATSAPSGALIEDIIGGMGLLQAGVSQAGAGDSGATAQDIGAYLTAPKLPDILYDGIGELLASTPYPDENGDPTDYSFLETIANGINSLAAVLYVNVLGPLGATDPVAHIDGLDEYAPYTDTAADRICQFDNGDGNAAQVSIAGTAASGDANTKMTYVGLGALDITAAGVYQTEATTETFSQDIVDALNAGDPAAEGEADKYSAPLTKMEIASYYNAVVDGSTAAATAAGTAAASAGTQEEADALTAQAAAYVAAAEAAGAKLVEFFGLTLADGTMNCTGVTPYAGPLATVTFNGVAQSCEDDGGAPARCTVTVPVEL